MVLDMRKLIALLVALAAGLLFMPNGSAQASDDDSPYEKRLCKQHTGSAIDHQGVQTVCVTFGWRQQTDGVGMTMEDAWTEVTQGCDQLEAAPNKLIHQLIILIDPDTGTSAGDGGRALSNVDCNAHYDMEETGADTGATRMSYIGEVNVNNGKNYCLYANATVRGDGTVLSSAFSTREGTPC